MKKWLKRIGLGVLALIALALTAGVTLEQWMRYRAPRDFPPPGKLVDIGGRRLQIDCRGSGSPTVIFEDGGAPGGSADWYLVQDEVALNTRACSYSRAGVMWSDPADGPRDGNTTVADLHTLLERAGERPPFVMTGWSLGGPYAVLYTHQYPNDVVGLVLVDAAHPDQIRRIEAITHRPYQAISPVEYFASKLSWAGVLRQSAPPSAPQPVQAKIAFLPVSLPAAIKEVASLDKTLAEVATAHDLGNRPVFVLTGMAAYSPEALQEIGLTPEEGRRFKEEWIAMQDDMASWSTNSRHELVPGAIHNIAAEKPQAVIGAVNDVVAAVRNSAPLKHP